MGRAAVAVLVMLCAACAAQRPLLDTQPRTIRESAMPGDTVEIERVDGTRQTLVLEDVTEYMLVGWDGRQRRGVPLASIRTITVPSMTSADRAWTAVGAAIAVGAIVAASEGGGALH